MAAPRHENLKQQILDAALRLFQTRPDFTLSEAAAEAGVSKGTLYYHYKTKNEILLDIGVRYWQQLSDDLIAWVDNAEKDTSMPRLAMYTLKCGIFDESGPLRLHLIADAVTQSADAESIREALVSQYVHFQQILRERIQSRMPGADADQTAWLLLTLMDGLLVQYMLKNTAVNVPNCIDRIKQSFEEPRG